MPRKPRIDYGGAIQHVAVNGNNHQVMFLHDRDRWELLGLLRTTAERYGWHVLAYCLMGHPLAPARTHPEDPLSRDAAPEQRLLP
jgi:hypothetical protein